VAEQEWLVDGRVHVVGGQELVVAGRVQVVAGKELVVAERIKVNRQKFIYLCRAVYTLCLSTILMYTSYNG
jgi:hypothetical protein